jgi:hypothetical protein
VSAPDARYVTTIDTPVDAYRGDDFGNVDVDVTPNRSPGSTASSYENVIGDVTGTYAERNPDRAGRRSTDAPPGAVYRNVDT